MVKSKLAKIDEKFNDDIKDIMKKRIAGGKDDPLKPKSIRKITGAITKHKYWPLVKLDIINHTFKEDIGRMGKRGQIGDLFLFMAIAIVTALFFGIMIFGFNLVNTSLSSINLTIPNTNITIGSISDQTLGQVNTALGTLRILSFVIIFGMIINILLGNFLVQKHPAYIMLYILVNAIAIPVSVYLSNFYQGMLTDATLGTTLSAFTGTNFLLVNLPYIVTIVGFFGLIFLLIGINQRPDMRPTIEV